MLQEPVEDGDLVIPNVCDLSELLDRLGAQIGIRFVNQGAQDHGYPIYRAFGQGGGARGWIWISPNTVRRGFVRERDPRYQELKDLMPGLADRYPGLPPNSYLVGTAGPWIKAVPQACEDLEIPVEPLREYACGLQDSQSTADERDARR
jgi:hypothetical protein